MRDFYEMVLLPIAVIAALAMAVIGGIFVLSNWYGSYQCGKYEAITGKATKWVTLDECYVQTADGWQRWDEYKIRAAASEGLKRAP